MIADRCRVARRRAKWRRELTGRTTDRVRLVTAKLGVLLLVILALGAPVVARAESDTRANGPIDGVTIRRLQVQVLPEFDDPRVLVIVQGHLASFGGALPETVTLQVPRGAEVNQVAAMNPTTGGVEGLQFEVAPDDGSEDWTLVTFAPTGAHFFYEYYHDPFTTDGPERSFTVRFPAFYTVEDMRMEIQVPLRADEFTLDPPTVQTRVDERLGFTYYQYELGPVEAGTSVAVDVAYVKRDWDPSVTREELMAAQVPAEMPTSTDDNAATPVQNPPRAGSSSRAGTSPVTLWVGLAIGVVVLAGLVRRRAGHSSGEALEVVADDGARKNAAHAQAPVEGYCSQCGVTLKSGARFCHHCGTRTKQRQTRECGL
jgi:hypothetical protein